MLPSNAPCFTGFRTVFVFALRPLLSMLVLVVGDVAPKFDLVITFD